MATPQKFFDENIRLLGRDSGTAKPIEHNSQRGFRALAEEVAAIREQLGQLAKQVEALHREIRTQKR